jgi:hypothetical protein
MRFKIGVRKKPTNQLNWENKIINKKSNYDKKKQIKSIRIF